MNAPFCRFDQKLIEYRNVLGRTVSEVVCWPIKCGHQHRYLDFSEEVQRLYPELHFGFDRRKERYVIFRWTPQIHRLTLGNDMPATSTVERILDIVIDMKRAIEVITPQKGRRIVFFAKPFGEWVLKELARYDPRRFDPDQTIVGDIIDERGRRIEAENQKNLRKNSEDFVNDMMSFADRGNPWWRRRQFRQRKLRPKHPKAEMQPA